MSQACTSVQNCEWPHCDCAQATYPWEATKHDIERREWERRFTVRISERAVDGDNNKLKGDALIEAVETELEAWPAAGDHNGPDWMWTSPEEAADEQMSNWLQDQEP